MMPPFQVTRRTTIVLRLFVYKLSSFNRSSRLLFLEVPLEQEQNAQAKPKRGEAYSHVVASSEASQESLSSLPIGVVSNLLLDGTGEALSKVSRH